MTKLLTDRNRKAKEGKDRFIPTRRSLLERLKTWDDQEAWKDFYHQYWKLIYGVGRRSGLNHAEAEDLVQDTVIAVAKKMPQFEYKPDQCTFKSWLLIVTRSRLSNLIAKLKIRPIRSENMSQPDGSMVSARPQVIEDKVLETIWNEEWAKNLVDHAILKVKSNVSIEQFQIFDLYVIKEMDGREVASILGVSLTKIYVTKHRLSKMLKTALAHLRQELES